MEAIKLTPVSGSRKGKGPARCDHCKKDGHVVADCWEVHPEKKHKSGGQWPGNRKKPPKNAGSAELGAQLSDLTSRLDGEKLASKEMAKDNRELSQENDVLKARLTVAEEAVHATRERHTAVVGRWTAGQRLRYRDRGVLYEDFATQMWSIKVSIAFASTLYAMVFHLLPFAFPFSLALYIPTLWISCIFAMSLFVYSFYYDLCNFCAGRGNGGFFRSYVTWQYDYTGEFVHAHTDERADNNALQAIKHAPRYAHFHLRKGVLIANRLFFGSEHCDAVVSVELLTQITNPKNLDPYLSPSEARSAFQRSAAHNHSVSIDRNLVLRGSYVYQETVCMAFFHYLLLREQWKLRDFLPTLPQ
jgi:regulator of replication initiation timing